MGSQCRDSPGGFFHGARPLSGRSQRAIPPAQRPVVGNPQARGSHGGSGRSDANSLFRKGQLCSPAITVDYGPIIVFFVVYLFFFPVGELLLPFAWCDYYLSYLVDDFVLVVQLGALHEET